jgi:hypothetical protein
MGQGYWGEWCDPWVYCFCFLFLGGGGHDIDVNLKVFKSRIRHYFKFSLIVFDWLFFLYIHWSNFPFILQLSLGYLGKMFPGSFPLIKYVSLPKHYQRIKSQGITKDIQKAVVQMFWIRIFISRSVVWKTLFHQILRKFKCFEKNTYRVRFHRREYINFSICKSKIYIDFNKRGHSLRWLTGKIMSMFYIFQWLDPVLFVAERTDKSCSLPVDTFAVVMSVEIGAASVHFVEPR